MAGAKDASLSFDEFDEIHYPRKDDAEFDSVVERATSRRDFLSGSLAFSATAFVLGMSANASAQGSESRFEFEAVIANDKDEVTLPKGYSYEVLTRWGDPLWSKGVEFDHKTKGTAASQAMAFGDNNDGMSFFEKDGKAVLAVNNEYINHLVMFADNPEFLPATDDDILKAKAAHGVSVLEVTVSNGKWSVVKDSKFNRRITPDTKMEITGPARGHDLMKTKADPTGSVSHGTWNNCGNGETPWGTYLTCEENFNGYFSSSDAAFKPTKDMTRYGIGLRDRGYLWARVDERFDISKHPNESNRVGYVVEIDPWNPDATPKKRTALGRFKHENAEVVIAKDNRVVVYLGDDERGEYLYRFVSSGKFVEGGDNSNLLEDGQLYAAKFNEDGKGEWLALTPETTKMASKAEICIYTRKAASAVKATTMDRPEWVAAHPGKSEVYCALTNNKHRGVKTNAGGDDTPVAPDSPNPRKKNYYGQIVRWRPEGEDHGASGFEWDLFVLAGNPVVHKDRDLGTQAKAGSSNVTAENMFNAPDGLSFDSKGLLWIQTDGKYNNLGDFEGMGNNQMLVGDPATGEIRRFLVGPNEAEITGLCWSTDKKTMFVGIQHPGERGRSNFPEGGSATPRSCVIAVKRDDGKEIG